MKPESDTIRMFHIFATVGFLIGIIVLINLLYMPKITTKIEIPVLDEVCRRIVELEKHSHASIHNHDHSHDPDHRHELIAEYKKWGRK